MIELIVKIHTYMMLNDLQIVLLRFREERVGAQGDIHKMYYMVRNPLEDQMMQLFMWKLQEATEVKVFCMTRLVMGNKPSGAHSTVGHGGNC